MRIVINIIFTLLVIFIVAKLFIYALPVIIIAIIGIWLYFKYKKRQILKKMREYENNMNEETYYNINSGSKENSKQKEEDTYTGPVIDVDYEEINKK